MTSGKPHYENVPFEIPENWEWVKLGIICDKIVDGDHNPPKGLETPTQFLMLSSRNINHNRIEDLDNVRYISEKVFVIENERTKLMAGDILFTSVGSLGRSCVYKGGMNLCFQRSVSIIHTLIYNHWLKYFFDSSFYQDYIIDKATGTAQLGFYLKQLEDSYIAVPPLNEQSRIVVEIEKWFALIDELEQNKNVLQEFIKQTKNNVLSLAIQGKLVPQNANEEPAIELLKRTNSAYKPCDTSHYPNLPSNWGLSTIKDLCTVISGLWKGKNPPFVNIGVIRNTNFSKDFRLDISDVAYLDVEQKQFEKRRLIYGDLILEKSGGSEKQPVGRTILYDKTDGEFSFSNFTAVLRINNKTIITPQYLYFALLNAYLNGATRMMQKQTTGIRNLIMERYLAITIPIPPIHEQERIVQSLENIYKIIDTINAEL